MDNRISQATTENGHGGTIPLDVFARRVLVVAGILLLFVAGCAAFVKAPDVFLLFFGGILLAILLRSAAQAVSSLTGLAPGWSLALVVIVLAAAAGMGVYFVGAKVVAQLQDLSQQIPKSLDQVRNYLEQRQWGRQLLEQTPTVKNVLTGGSGNVASSLGSFFSTTLGIAGNLLVVTFLSLYLAASPHKYVEGALALVPRSRRSRAEHVVDVLGYNLKWWLIGRLVAMVAVAIITLIGLMILGIREYLILAILSGLLTAIPFFGPIIAAVPAILLGLMDGPATAMWVAGIYVLAQSVENYLLTPLIQQKLVNLPPVLTIVGVTLAGALFGVIGLIVASPLLVVVLVSVKMLYLEDALNEPVHIEEAASATP